MKKLLVIPLSIVLLAGLIMSGCTAPASTPEPSPTPAPVIELNFNHPWPAPSTAGRALQAWAELVEQRSNGRVKIEIFASGALAGPLECYDACRSGMYEITESAATYTPGDFPLSGVTQLPLVGMPNAITNSTAWWALFEETPELQAEYEGLHVIGAEVLPPNRLQSKVPIRSLEDMKGRKIRGAGFPQADIVTALGGVPVSVSFNEIYSSLEKGVVDATLTPMQSIPVLKLTEVASYYTMFDFGTTPMPVAMNLDVWNGLPEDIKQVFNDLGGMQFAKHAAPMWDADNDIGISMVKEQGQEIIYLSDEEAARWQEVLQPVIDKWVNDIDSQGLPGTETIDKYIELLEKYRQ